jgi:hypothetical protein
MRPSAMAAISKVPANSLHDQLLESCVRRPPFTGSMSRVDAQPFDFVLDFQLLSFEIGDGGITCGWVQHCCVQFSFEISMLLLKSLDMGFNCHRHFLPVFAHIRPSYSPDVSGCNNPSLPRYFRFVEGEITKKENFPLADIL